MLTQPLPGQLKQNLSVHRVINFVAIAWLAARFVHSGGIARGSNDWKAHQSRAAVNGAGCG